MSNSTLSDQILQRANGLEDWLERTKSKKRLLPARLLGYGLLVGLLLTSNVFALLRWPIASLLEARPARGTPSSGTPSSGTPSSTTAEQDTEGVPPAGAPIAVDAEELDVLLDGGRPVLVDFWAAWCGPCIMMNEALRRVAKEVGTACVIAKVNTMEHKSLAEAYGVKGLPTLILFTSGEETVRHAGALSTSELRSWLAEHLPTQTT